MSKITETEFLEEQNYAEKTAEILKRTIDEETAELAAEKEEVYEKREHFIDYFGEMHEDEREDWLQFEHKSIMNYEETHKFLQRHIKQLMDPYFGKVVFKDDEEEEAFPVYVGLYSLIDDMVPVIYDWRAPVCSLYYENEVGKAASYEAPMGTIQGEIEKKLRITFKKGQLKSAVTVNLPSDDETLNDILSQNSSDTLKVIVSSLQKDQNRIVRDYISGVKVISGCAGSGKTSVAMHKIAYIMYSYKDKLENGKVLVISPNDTFSSYIAGVLPALGEDSVESVTQEDLAKQFYEQFDFQCSGRENSTERMLMGDEKVVKSIKFKNSMLFKEIIDEYVKYFELYCFKPSILYLDEEERRFVSADKIRAMYYEEFNDLPAFSKIPEITNEICVANRVTEENVRELIENQLYDMFTCTDFTEIYRKMFFDKEFLEMLPEDIKAKAPELSDMLITPYFWEDGAAAAYLYIKLTDIQPLTEVIYIFCDEAQDLSPVMLAIIDACFMPADKLFAGDSIQNVFCAEENYCETIKKSFPFKGFKKYELNTNYRSTAEISEFASKQSGRSDEQTTIRHGEEPEIIGNNGDTVQRVNEWLEKINGKSYERVAILTITKSEADDLNARCELPTPLNVNVKFLPVYIAKGLEFDAVLVIDENNKMREKDSVLGTNMFYTACTRALHELAVIV